jgi:hypothetical protein
MTMAASLTTGVAAVKREGPGTSPLRRRKMRGYSAADRRSP